MIRFSKTYLVTIFGTGFFVSVLLFAWSDQSYNSLSNIIRAKERVTPPTPDGQDVRLTRLHQTCPKYQHLMNTTFYKKERPVYLTAPKYKWTFCKVGKSGSTFWGRFTYILSKNGSNVDKVSQITRDKLHTEFTKVSFKDPRSYSTRLVLTVRNPYTRLFSAYIDRIFTVSTTPLVIRKNGEKCKSQISFKEFLQFVIDSFDHNESEFHSTPLFYTYKPCEIKPNYIFKIETFKSDFTSYINLNELEPYKRDTLTKAIAEQTNFSISTLVADVLDASGPLNMHHALDCQTTKQITIRLWTSLKIQGYVAERASFPFDRYERESDFDNATIFREIVFETRKLYPLTKSEMTAQRRKALNRFYKEIDSHIIERIQKIYSANFELFGYSLDPPPW